MATTTHTMTGLEFDALPYEEGRRWELVNGELVEMPSATLRHQEIVSRILIALREHLAEQKALVVPDVEFALSADDRVRPDVCVILGDNADRVDVDRIPISGAPDIAIEVISPSERASESHAKVRNYLRKGTSEVWQIFPLQASAEIHSGETSRSLDRGGKIMSNLLPEFELAIESLFV